MTLDRINRLVTKEGLAFQAWDDRYSKGVWAAIGFNECQIDVIRDLTDAGDLDMMHAMDFIERAQWLPYVTAPTFLEALQKLEERLASLPQDQLTRGSHLNILVNDAVDTLFDAFRGRSWYSDGATPTTLVPLPETLELALARYRSEGGQA